MKGFSQTLFDKLLGDSEHAFNAGSITRLSIEQVKDAVAADLEALLNTRSVIFEEDLQAYPECHRSIISYGLCDFAGLSLASIDDRTVICRGLERAISRHEPRLRNVQATLELDKNSINKLNFAITAFLVVHQSKEPVSFDALLQPSTLQYSISSARRTAVRMET
ncbi:MAG: type VI secretion system baseplate subunit TssE [Polaromonas sp.]|uniref:type VI secretion system baseplate subunit TssE n=1 Tax=Polaromonas sp. TaxID=1869339 RepID=UPI001841CBA0|nr:type VI secretion system baseplate subunit TssE [Polaromonas sp.]NMM10517.1 type VI secretion system baseplate subunit TssE [Polaromonas sp.]